MPWDAASFASKHNHKLAGTPGADVAARQATAMVRKGVPDGIAIATANKTGDRKMRSYSRGGEVDAGYSDEDTKRVGAKKAYDEQRDDNDNDKDDRAPLNPGNDSVSSPYEDKEMRRTDWNGEGSHDATFAHGGAVGGSSRYMKGC